MTAMIILLLSALAILSLTGIALSIFAAWQTRAVAAAAAAREETWREEAAARVQTLEERLDAMTAQMQELALQPAVTLAAGMPKPGMNVVKRAQALRLHRRGDRPEQIATALDLPRQEVDLLLKVHSIVISNI